MEPYAGDGDAVLAAKLAEELWVTWIAPLKRRGWGERLCLMEEIDRELERMPLPSDIHVRISRRFTFMVIDSLDELVLGSLPQAYIYLNSENELQREAGRAWLVLNAPNSPLLLPRVVAEGGGAERRLARRHQIALFGQVLAEDGAFSGRLLDLSRSGARLSADTGLCHGEPVQLLLPLLGRVEAVVAWAAESLLGLAFLPRAAQPA